MIALTTHRGTSARLYLIALLMASLGLPTSGSAQKPISLFRPDVVVLILSGVGTADEVSISYVAPIPGKQVNRDVSVLCSFARWTIRNLHVTAAQEGGPASGASFNVPGAVNARSGVLTLEPFILALKRFRGIEVIYLNVPRMRFRGLEEFENEFVKIKLSRSGNTYTYRIRVKDSGFERLDLPLAQPQPGEKAARGSRALQILLVLGMAVAAAAVAFLAASRMLKAKASSG